MRVKTVGPEARLRLIPRTGVSEAYRLRAPIREAIAALKGEDTIELEREKHETLRQVKVVARRAAKEVGLEIQYGETEEDTLLVWLAQPRRRRQGRTVEPAPDNLAAQVP